MTPRKQGPIATFWKFLSLSNKSRSLLSIILPIFSALPPCVSAQEVVYLDVFYGEQFVESVLAEYDEQQITLFDAELLEQKLPETLDRAYIREYLSRPIRYLSPNACNAGNISRCFEQSAEKIIFTFDSELFAVQVFIAPSLLPVHDVELDDYLPGYSGTPSYLSRVSALYSYIDQSQGHLSSYNLFMDQVFSSGDKRLVAQLGKTDSESYYARSVYFSSDRKRERFLFGRYELPGNSLTPGRLIYGAGLQTTNDLRLDLEQVGATQLEYFMPQRSRVEIYRDGRLLSVKYYPTGNNSLDVSDLPVGAYDIHVKIFVDDVVVQEDTRFFSKSSTLPPVGESVFRMDAGLITDVNQFASVEGSEFLRWGYGFRLNDANYLEAEYLSNHYWRSFQMSHRWLRKNMVGDVSLLQADDGYRAFALNSSYRTLYGSYGLTWTQGDPGASSELPEFRRFNIRAREYGVRYGYHFQSLSLQANVRKLESDLDDTIYSSLSAYISKRIGRDSALSVSSSLAYDERSKLSASVSVTLTFSGNSGAYWARAGWRDREDDEFQHAVGLSGRRDSFKTLDSLRYAAQLEQRGERKNLGADIDLSHERFRHVSSLNVSSGENTTTAYSGIFNTAFNVSKAGVRMFDGADLGSGILVSLPSEHQSPVVITVDGARHIVTTSGGVQFIPLQPYRVSNVSVSSRSGAALEYDSTEKQVVLYPGHVPVLEWVGIRVLPVFGQVSFEGKAEDTRVIVKTSRGSDVTENNGFFAVDLATDSPLIEFSVDGRACDIAVDIQDAQPVIDLGLVRCSL